MNDEAVRTAMIDPYRVVIESSLTGFYLIVDDCFAYVNAALAQMFGYTAEELIGEEVIPKLVWPPDRSIVETSHLRRIAGEVDVARYRFRGLRKDGSVFPVEAHGRGICYAGKKAVMGTLVDFTERLRAESELRESQALLEKAQRVAHVGWWERDLAAGRVTLSLEVCRTLGLEPESITSWRDEQWLAIVHPDDREKTVAAAQAALQGQLRYDCEYRIIRADGSVRIVRNQGEVTQDDAGTPLRVFGALQDITELRQAQEELRASEERFRTFVDHATDAFFMLEQGGAILDVNRQASADLGYARDELVGGHLRRYDVDYDDAVLAPVRERVANGEAVSFETRYRRHDGTIYPVEIRIRSFEHHGSKLLATVRDVTDRKRAEQRTAVHEAIAHALAGSATAEEAIPRVLAAVCEHLDWALGAFWLVDREGAGLRPSGIWRAGAVAAPNLEPAIRATSFSRGAGLPGRIWATRSPEFLAELPSGSAFPVATAARRDGFRTALGMPVLLGKEVLGIVVLFHREPRRVDGDALDVTAAVASQVGQFLERRHNERALQLVQAELDELDRVMTINALTTSIAHEIKQPIAATVANASAARLWLGARPPNVVAAAEAVRRIAKDGIRAGEVADRIRDLVKKTPAGLESVDLNQAIREVIEMTRTEASRHRVSVAIDLAAMLPPVNGDRVQIQQVVLNLTMNAIEALSGVSEGPRELEIRTSFDDGAVVLVSVRDSGPGFAPRVREHLFEMFNTTKPNGLGLGLAICRSIVDVHGGRLWAEPQEPRGAAFHFTIPSSRAAAGAGER